MMYHDALPYLRCPGCLDAALELESGVGIAADGAIVQGGLRCTLCARLYPIKHGVLDLSDPPDPRLFPHIPTQFVYYLPPMGERQRISVPRLPTGDDMGSSRPRDLCASVSPW